MARVVLGGLTFPECRLFLFLATGCVVDAYGLLYQVFHARGMEMTNALGETDGAFGFVRGVLAIMNKCAPTIFLRVRYAREDVPQRLPSIKRTVRRRPTTFCHSSTSRANF